MDLEEISKRITALEELLGIEGDIPPTPIPETLDALHRKLRDECKANLLLSIPVQKLELLNKIATETSGPYGSLAQKIESINFAEKLVNERAARLKTFTESLEPAIDPVLFGSVCSRQAELDEEIKGYESALEQWKLSMSELNTLVGERGMINEKITEKTLELQQKIDSKVKN